VQGPPFAARNVIRDHGVLLATYVVAMLLFFRAPVLSGFDLGFGDRADGLIEISILEHWRNVLIGTSNWATTGYFYPYAGTLGYNDGYFLYGLVYSFWRLFADPFLADTLNIFTFKTIGFFAAYALVARSLNWGRRSALFVASIFTIANGLWVQAGHAQLHIVALLPVAMILVITIVRAEREGRQGRSRIAAIVLAALLAAWLLTAYYMAWFAIFFSALYVTSYAALIIFTNHRLVFVHFYRRITTLFIFLFSFIACLIPFLILYLPKLRETNGHGFKDHSYYLIRPLDLINVGSENYLWGWLIRLFRDAMGDAERANRVMGGEHVTGFPVLLFVLILVAAIGVIAGRRPATGQPVPPELRALALALIMSWVFALKLFGFSFWQIVSEFVPGAGGIRVILRYQLFLILPALLLVVWAHRERAHRLMQARPWLMSGVIMLLIAEQLGGASAAHLSRSAHRAELWAIPAPPAACRSFYIVAMFLAQRWRLPTINGFSTFNPPDWEFADPLASSYDFRAMGYARRHELRRVCRLDMRDTKPWRLMPETE
jgi:hypothetical protein